MSPVSSLTQEFQEPCCCWAMPIPRSQIGGIAWAAGLFSPVAPEKIRFRYELEGHDSDWQDAGNLRQAFYNDLPPRNYHVAAFLVLLWGAASVSPPSDRAAI